MSAVGSGVSTAVTRNRSCTAPVALFWTCSHTEGRQATTGTVRRMLCRTAINPCATCSRTRPPSPADWAVPASDWASSVSIWSTASTAGPASATSRAMSRTHSCADAGAVRRPHGPRSSALNSSLPCRKPSPMSWATKSLEPSSTRARSA